VAAGWLGWPGSPPGRTRGGRNIHPAPRRPRVGVDLRALVRRPTGIGVYTLELLRELVKGGGLDLIGMSHAPVRDERELAELGIGVEVARAPLGVVWQQVRLPARLGRGDIDLFWSPLLTLPHRLPVPGVVTVHDLAVLHHPEALTWKIRWSLLPFLGRTVERAARLVCVSRAVEAEIHAQWPAARGRTVVIPNGVSEEFRPASPEERREIRGRLGLPDRFLLYAGTVEPRKNLEVLLDAWERLRRDSDAAPPLLVAGPEGWSSASTERRMAALSPHGLRRLGHLERRDLVDTMRAATLFVYPSFYEGFGLPPLESLACGVPAVVADRSSLPEVVGDAGFYFDPDDTEELVAVLHRALESPATLEAAGARGVERARSFRWKRAAADLARLFGEVLAEARPPAKGAAG
jgi:glycosyltransferase involved in cell wall biosynthesis